MFPNFSTEELEENLAIENLKVISEPTELISACIEAEAEKVQNRLADLIAVATERGIFPQSEFASQRHRTKKNALLISMKSGVQRTGSYYFLMSNGSIVEYIGRKTRKPQLHETSRVFYYDEDSSIEMVGSKYLHLAPVAEVELLKLLSSSEQ